jgi:serine protease Do
MNNFSPRQLIAAVFVVSIATSLLVSISAVSTLTRMSPNQLVREVVPSLSTGGSAGTGASEKVVRQDELVVAAVKRVSPSVVSIVATKDVPVVEQYFVNPFPDDPFFQQFFGNGGAGIPQYRQKGTQKQEVSAGTGFVVSADGLILTNKHVVADTAAEYTVFFNDGTKFPTKVLARDPVQDLAVVKIDRSGLTPVVLGDSSQIDIGETVIAIGNALGEFRNTVSVGVVSGLHRSITASGGGTAPEELQELIQTDAAINPGNSGGPLLNVKGEVIGIDTAMASGAENIGFAFPINQAKRDIESVKSFGRIIYPFLGVRYVMVTKDVQSQKKLAVDYGALIVGDQNNPAISTGSPAEKAGLKTGDVILELNGEKLQGDTTLASLINKYRVSDTATLKVLRGSDTITVSVTFEERK